MIGIISYGAYVPLWRLRREVISRGGRGEKSVASFDEDSLTMAVSAVNNSLAGMDRELVDALFFASTTFPYKEKQGSSIVAAATDLRRNILTIDSANTLRGGTSSVKLAKDMVRAGSARNIAVVASDCRLGEPGSVFEQICGDGAGALVIGDTDVAVEIEGTYSVYNEMIDVWRADDDKFVRAWEDRFIQSQGYIKGIQGAVRALMKDHSMEPRDFAKAVIYAPDQKRVAELVAKLGFDPEKQLQDPLISAMGNTGTAYPLMLLIASLEDAKPGDRILWASYGDGSDVLILKVAEAIENIRDRKGMKKLLASKKDLGDYTAYLTRKGLLKMDRGPKYSPQVVSATALWRDLDEVIRLYGVKCNSCGTIQYPPQRICTKCHARDQFEKVRLSDKRAKLFTYSLDFVSNPLEVPMVVPVIDFDGGGRSAGIIMTDQDPKELQIGMPLEMSFRKLFSNDGIHNYFWKCAPLRT